jgi:hypothetical protein
MATRDPWLVVPINAFFIATHGIQQIFLIAQKTKKSKLRPPWELSIMLASCKKRHKHKGQRRVIRTHLKRAVVGKVRELPSECVLGRKWLLARRAKGLNMSRVRNEFGIKLS